MNNINHNLNEKIDELNRRIEKLVDLVDKRPSFYNNIFFEDKSKNVPINLINTDYININSKKEKPKLNILFKEDLLKNKNYLLEEPLHLLDLPSSDESDNEDNNEEHITFKSICDEIYDYEYLKINKDDDKNENNNQNKKGILPLLMFKTIPELSTIHNVLNYCKHKVRVTPYEIKKISIPEIKTSTVFIVKFYSSDDAKKAKKSLTEDYNVRYNINFHLCYDKRELKNKTNWYCVVFRRDYINNKNNHRFVDIINEIFDKITCEKKIITIDMNGKIYKVRGNIFYSAIRVDNLNDAINLCIKYNKFSNLKVHLHYLTYENSKKELPQVLLKKNFIKDKILSLSEDEETKNFDLLFPSRNKIKIKKYKKKSF